MRFLIIVPIRQSRPPLVGAGCDRMRECGKDSRNFSLAQISGH